MYKKMILIATAMLMGSTICFAQADVKTNSERAANQAKQGNTVGAANTASKTWQNDGFSKSTPGSSNLNDIVSKKAEEARTAASKETGNNTAGSSGTANKNSNNSGNTNSKPANTGSGTNNKTNKK